MIVLDTHIWWWALNEPEQLTRKSADKIEKTPRGQIYIAAISLWEIALLFHKKRIMIQCPPQVWIERALKETAIQVIPLVPEVAVGAYQMPGEFHGDPADRLIVASARYMGVPLITKDEKIRAYPHVNAIWD